MRWIVVAVLALSAASSWAQVPKDQLARPPADARRYVIMSTAGKHGEASEWTAPDGTRWARASLVLRGQVWEIDEAATIGPDGMVARYVARGVSPQGDVAETFAVTGGKAEWTSPIDKGSAPYKEPAIYYPAGPGSLTFERLVERLIAAPGHEVALLPGGRAKIEPLAKARIGSGARALTVLGYAVTGITNSSIPVWATEDGKFFASIGFLSTIPVGYEDSQPVLEKAQDEALAARSPALARRFLGAPAGPVAFTDVRAFVDGSRFAEGQTVVVDKGRIVAVGPSASTKVPAGARLIDGRGKTLVPGLWDAHMHFGDDSSGPMLLSLGITSARDPGNVTALTLARRERRAKGELLSPRVYSSTLIDGKGPNTAQVADVATSQEEAIEAVRRAKANGMTGVKFYGTFNPAWLPAAAAEAHRLGLHVHGHVPAGMRTLDAIEAGYDEVTHIYFMMMQAMPDEVVAVSNGIQRFQGPGRYAKDVDLEGETIRKLIAEMARRKIVADPTLVVAEGLFVPENGDLSPAYAPFVGTLPPATERGFRQGGFAVPAGVTRADWRASYRKLAGLVGAMHKAGVPVVAGTDGSGLELVRELELYVDDAGFTPAEALAAATIVPARLVGAEAETGSIAVGKAADLVLVDGDPSKRIGDLRHTRWVMMDGRLMDADALRAAGGFAGKPKFAE
ncbi:MAG TPA: amidohydrolase family protein [Allosphingosinicella sp.]|nr:amidohydrolase family protein [Allosphingosinicella sp.]